MQSTSQNHQTPGPDRDYFMLDEGPRLELLYYDMIKYLSKEPNNKVILAKCVLDQKLVAIKVFPKIRNRVNKSIEIKLRKEIDLLTWKDSIRIPSQTFSVKYLGVIPGYLDTALVFEFIGGITLLEAVRDRRGFPPNVTKFYICELISALRHLHLHSISFNNLDCKHVMLESNGHLKLINFSNAKAIEFQVNHWKKYTTLIGDLTPNPYSKDWVSLNRILHSMLEPDFISKPGGQECLDFIRFLNFHLETNKELTFEDIINHPWFNGINWEHIKQCKYAPPFLINQQKLSQIISPVPESQIPIITEIGLLEL
ncbi:hypothetical protein CROQUDRAFT_41765 [Cronartium quercuum f. sp. fusiforme G11]|uniref:Protein kinase domain-containing protein n=1 Tax=Cronartium quercuum f. sp. fusiforme G11 TaxID=708437 RepID=A0A9P6NJJ3_9BASI|nr:hypothetical protein CROQUDRAFT_41765 [Cronartium quercuum f. sp. fusiforme G11]